MLEPKPNKQRALIATTLIWTILGVRISFVLICLLNIIFTEPADIIALNQQASTTTSVSQYDDETGTYTTPSTSATFDHEPQPMAKLLGLVDFLIGLIYRLLIIASIITFIMWFRRAYYNLYVKGIKLKYEDHWAAGSWFVPFLNLYRPFEMMKELFARTKEILTGRKGFSESILSTKILNYWWVLLIGDWILGRITKMIMMNSTVDEIIEVSILYLVVNIIGILSALITIRLINNYSKAEQILVKNEEDDEFEPEAILAYDAGFE